MTRLALRSIRGIATCADVIRRGIVGGPFLGRAFALAVAATSGAVPASTGEPQGTPVRDPELAALLRPSAGVVEDHITQSNDGEVYYSATLKHFALPGFTRAYLAELEDKGLRILPVASSPHVLPQHIIGYDLIAWREASLNPYSIRFREGNEREGASAYERLTPPTYPHPVSVRLDRLVVRLPAEFAEPWKTAVVVPTENQVKLPYPVPLPADAVVRGVTEDRLPNSGALTILNMHFPRCF